MTILVNSLPFPPIPLLLEVPLQSPSTTQATSHISALLMTQIIFYHLMFFLSFTQATCFYPPFLSCFLELAHLEYYFSQVGRLKIIDFLKYNWINSLCLNGLGFLGGLDFARVGSGRMGQPAFVPGVGRAQEFIAHVGPLQGLILFSWKFR